MKKILLLSVALASIALLSACETMAGLGTDISKGGQELHNAARRNSN